MENSDTTVPDYLYEIDMRDDRRMCSWMTLRLDAESSPVAGC